MRLALITVSAIALTGCTWFGGGAKSGSNYFNGQSAANCLPQAGFGQAGFGQQGFGQQGFGQAGFGQQGFQGAGGIGCGPAGGYSVSGGQFGQAGFGQGGFGQAGFGQQGFGQGGFGQAGFGQQGFGTTGFAGAQGVGATGFGLTGIAGAGNVAQGPAFTAGFAEGFGANTNGLRGSFANGGFGQQVTTLGAAAPFGAAVGGQQFIGGQQFVNGGFAQGANVQSVIGQPIFVPQAIPFGVAGGFIGAASPFGFEGGIGTDFGIGGDISPLRDETTSNGFGFATDGTGAISDTRVVSVTPAISYNDAFDEAIQYDAAATYDVGPNTTLLGRFGYSDANGQSVDAGSAFEFATPQVISGPINIPAGSAASPVTATFSDLEQITLEAGVRQYVGGFGNGITGIRPYVGATAGAIRNNDVDVTLSSAAFASTGGTDAPINFIESGWNPTASGVVGAEWQVGPTFAVGAETGIRWQDNLSGLTADAEDRFSVPVRLRGRMSF